LVTNSNFGVKRKDTVLLLDLFNDDLSVTELTKYRYICDNQWLEWLWKEAGVIFVR